MVSKILRFTCKFYSSNIISKSRNMNLDKCYFRYIENEEIVNISFLLKLKDSVKQFNLSRKASESLQFLLPRISNNVKKFIYKINKKNISDDVEIEVKFYDDKNNEIPKSITCLELFNLQSPVKLLIYDHVLQAVFNCPWVVNISLPKCLLVGFPVYPEQFVTYHTRKDKCDFIWYSGLPVNNKGNKISESHVKWNSVGKGFVYIPTSQDIGMKLKLECIPGNGDTVGPVFERISEFVVEAGPGKCPFETRQMFTQSKLSDKSFRCVSYNILADLYCNSDHTRTVLHPYCPPYALHIDYRKQLIIKELLGYNADIICLQEVDRKIFYNYLKEILGFEGLNGEFYKKGKEVAEGLACFYRHDRFSILHQEQILLSQVIKTEPYLKAIWDGVKDNGPLLERLLDRSTAASATILRSHDNPKDIVIVGNTHLYFHPDADHIRLIQGGIVIYWLNEIKKNQIIQNPDSRISLIICGDFNSVPSCGLFKLYTTGIAPSSLPDWQSNIQEAVDNVILKQDTLLGSACGTPEFTNFTDGFADCLDYIFYEKGNFEVEQVVPFPSVEELKVHTALPSIVFPSDHIALISDLRFV